ncbi:Ubiquilin [Astathelohania contejeani]|uniref:Ubiquilin n=1 Tax=Astathelohania contejeani TaxID=164912 RepID=A0ABQ7HXN1_9MICR|nr:Ubiquilin [Thelohania contejeani]
MAHTITLRLQNRSFDITLPSTATLKELRTWAEKQCQIPQNEIVLIHEGRVLNSDQKTLDELELPINSVITVTRRPTAPAPQATKPDLLANPMLKGFLKDPETMKSMIEMFPGIKDEMETNPDLRNALNNPQLIEEFENFAENPEYIQQQMKNVDIAMNRLSNLPGGLNMMNSMIKDVRDPLTSVLDRTINSETKIKAGTPINQSVSAAIPNPGSINGQNSILRFRKQLAELRKYGFTNTEKNIMALKKHNGDIEGAMLDLAEDGM